MSSFTTRLALEPLDDGCTWRLLEPFTYDVGELGGTDQITVPEGFLTDFASVPRGLWNLFPPWGPYGKAAVLHDYLYTCQDRKRSECDAIFLEAMSVLNVSWWKRRTIYFAVRMGGWVAWRGHTKAKERRADCKIPKNSGQKN